MLVLIVCCETPCFLGCESGSAQLPTAARFTTCHAWNLFLHGFQPFQPFQPQISAISTASKRISAIRYQNLTARLSRFGLFNAIGLLHSDLLGGLMFNLEMLAEIFTKCSFFVSFLPPKFVLPTSLAMALLLETKTLVSRWLNRWIYHSSIRPVSQWWLPCSAGLNKSRSPCQKGSRTSGWWCQSGWSTIRHWDAKGIGSDHMKGVANTCGCWGRSPHWSCRGERPNTWHLGVGTVTLQSWSWR